jgi:hypothetical protein
VFFFFFDDPFDEALADPFDPMLDRIVFFIRTF